MFVTLYPTGLTMSAGFKDPMRMRYVSPDGTVSARTRSYLRRIFVIVQYVLVTFQSIMYILIPVSKD
jgi:hypothetical protein